MKPRRDKHSRNAADQADWAARLQIGVLGGAVALVVASTLIYSEGTIDEGTYTTIAAGWCVLLIAWSLALWLDRRPAVQLGWTEIAAAALVGWHTLTGIVALGSGNGRQTLNSVWLHVGYCLTAFLLRQTLRSAAQVRALFGALLWLALLLATLGFYQYFYLHPARRQAYASNPEQFLRDGGYSTAEQSAERQRLENRLFSTEPLATFALTNSLAGVLAPWLCAALAVALAMRRDADQRRTLIGLLAIAVPLAGCLLLTKSRTAYLATAVGLGLIALYGRPSGWRLNWRIPAAAAGVLVVLGLAAVYFGGLDAKVLSESPKSVLYRLEYWQATAAMIADHPLFGCGPGNFQETYTTYKLPQASEAIADPHNFLLEMWATSGTPAVILLLLVFVALAADLSRAARAPIAADETSDKDAIAKTAHRTIFGGALAGLLLAPLLALIADFPLDSAFDGGWLPVVWVLGVPLLAACWWLFEPWISRGRLLPAAAVIPMIVLLVNLLAAGAIGFPGVIATLLVLGPAALCLAQQGGVNVLAVGSGRMPRQFVLAKNAPAGLALAAIGLTLVCLVTQYMPVLYSRGALEMAIALGNAGQSAESEKWMEQAAKADPRWPEPWRLLADVRLKKWLASSAEPDWERFLRAADEFEKRNSRHHLTHFTRGAWFLTAWRKSGRAELFDRALAEFRRAIDRYPNWALYHAQLAWTLHLGGRDGESRSAADAAKRLDDLTPHADQKLRMQRIVDPQVSADGTITALDAASAEQIVERLRTTSGTPPRQENPP